MGHPADHPGPFVLVEDLEAPVLPPEDVHHLERVLRVRPGDPLVVGDGAGRWRPARFGPSLEPTGPVEATAPPAPALGVAFALVKGDRPELVVQKLTELGIDRIVPFRAARSIVRWDDVKAAKAVVRLRTIARAATMQCHRPWLPVVAEVADAGDLLGQEGVAMADREGAPLALVHPLVLVGPEGGWAPEELDAARRRGVPRVALGPHVLRAETAALTLGSLLAALREGIVTPVTNDPHA
jgi:16S rRNA (uracil1498-N3)-methyltransferase